MLTGSSADIPVLKQFGAVLGQSWDDIIQSWQNGSYVESLHGRNTTIDPERQYTWYANVTNVIAEVSGLRLFSRTPLRLGYAHR